MDPALVKYLQANKGGAGYLVAVSSAMNASPIILNTDEPVISLGGYNGVDPVFTPEKLADLANRGERGVEKRPRTHSEPHYTYGYRRGRHRHTQPSRHGAASSLGEHTCNVTGTATAPGW